MFSVRKLLKKAVALAVVGSMAVSMSCFTPKAEAGNVFENILGTLQEINDVLGGSGSSSGGGSSGHVNLSDTKYVENMSQDQRMFWLAMENGDYVTMQKMVDKGVDLSAVYKIGDFWTYTAEDKWTPFYFALWRNNRDLMQWLLERGADIMGFTHGGKHKSYLVYAVHHCPDVELIQYLLNWGIPIDDKSYDEWGNVTPPIAMAINAHYIDYANGYYEVAKYLIEHGADIEFLGRSNNGKSRSTPLIEAASGGGSLRHAFVELFLSHGANVNAKDSDGKTAMDHALQRGDYELVKLIDSYSH